MMVASSGGHWIQLIRLNDAFAGHQKFYVTTNAEYNSEVKGHSFYSIQDANRWDRVKLFILASKMLWLLIRVQPNVVVSTGALPGFFALLFAKLLGRIKTTIKKYFIKPLDQNISLHKLRQLTFYPPHNFGKNSKLPGL